MNGSRSRRDRVWLSALLIAVGLETTTRLYDSLVRPDYDYLLRYETLDVQVLRHIKAWRGYEEEHDSRLRIAVNAKGFRGNEFEPASPRRRVVACLGNGSTHGDAVPDTATWPALLEQLLATQTNGEIKVYNLGTPGAGVVFARAVLVDEALSLSPRVAVVAFAGLNEALQGVATEHEQLSWNAPGWRILSSSKLFEQLERFGYGVRNRLRGVPRLPRVSLSEYEFVLSDLILTLRQHDVDVILLSEEVLHPDIQGYFALADFDRYRDAQRRVAVRTGVPLVDPRDLFREVEVRAELFQANQILYSIDGNRRIAGAIANLPLWRTIDRD